MLVVFLNLDEVIRIIREEDDAKAALKAAFKLTDMQTDYILDTRFAPAQARGSGAAQGTCGADQGTRRGRGLLADEPKQWRAITAQSAS